MTSLNHQFTRLSMRRRYESWFVRFGLGDGSGAWCKQIFASQEKPAGVLKWWQS